MNELFVKTYNRYPVSRCQNWLDPNASKEGSKGPKRRGSTRSMSITSLARTASNVKASSGALINQIKVGPGPAPAPAPAPAAERSPRPSIERAMSRSKTIKMEEDPTRRRFYAAEKVLGEMVDGYKEHLQARRQLYVDEKDYMMRSRAHQSLQPGLVSAFAVNVEVGGVYELRMAPRFCDLMMWAVLAGAHELAKLLWTRSEEPIRAAVMASQSCLMLSRDESLRADRDELVHESDAYESLAIEVLDAIRESDDAAPLLSLVPWSWEMGSAADADKPPKRVLLWNESVIDTAKESDGILSFPCMRLIAHRHTQFTLEQFFAGDFAGSRARVPPGTSLLRMLLQALLPILPGTIVEVMPCMKPPNELLQGKQTEKEYEELVQVGHARSRKVDIDSLNASRSVSRSGSPVPGIEWDPDMIDIVSEIEKAKLNTSATESDAAHQKRGWWYRLTMTHAENSGMDVLADLISARFAQYYLVPKVKFMTHFAGHIAFLAYFSYFLLSQFSVDLTPPIGPMEVFLWIWCVTRFSGELFEVGEWTGKGLWIYIRDVWNLQDVLFIALATLVCSLRLASYLSAADDPIGSAASTYGFVELAPRSLYAFMIILAYLRVLQYLRYFRSVGVLTIVIGHMMADVGFFSVILVFVSLGFGFAFSVMMPQASSQESPLLLFGDAPLYAPFWGIFGSFYRSYEYVDDALDPGMVIAPTLLWVYLFITTVVLVNLLIAQMSDTYSRVTGEGLLVWQFERAQLINEFKDTKPPLPPPFNVIWFGLVTLPSWLHRSYRRHQGEVDIDDSGFKLVPKQLELNALRQREEEALKRCLQAREKRDEETLEARITQLNEKHTKLDEQGRQNFELLNGRFDEIEKIVRGK